MKTKRGRMKHALCSIKQEDTKHDSAIPGSFTSAATDISSTVEPTIKQEDAKEDKELLKQNGDFGNKGYYYRCDRCELKMVDLKSVLEHRNLIHIIDQRFNNTKIKNINTEPDVHDPNFYCKSCERSYKDRNKYRQHLKCAHYMVLKPIPSWKAPRKGNTTDTVFIT
ncbi:hypothetical protein MBANPS3_003802 [Mucor bainieri]